MTLPTASTALPPLLVDKAAIAKANPRVQSAARWFWWIAGLSLVNSVVLLSGGNFNFVVGLAITQIADAIFQQVKVVAMVVDALVLGFFIGAGLLARRGQVWAFVVGGIAYLLDGILCALFEDWMSAAFHAYALFWIFHGWKELRVTLRTAAETPVKVSETTPAITAPATPEPPRL